MSALLVAAKLVILTANGIAVTDYPSMQRCEQARTVLEKALIAKARENAPNGYHLAQPPAVTVVCIPA